MEFDAAAVIGSERSKIVFEALSVGHSVDDWLPVRHVPFADASGLVTDGFDEFGKGDFVGGHAPAETSGGVASGKKSGARWSANRLSVEAGKPGAFHGELVETGCFELFISVATDIAITLIVGEDDQYIGAELSRSGQRNEKSEREGKQVFHEGDI